MNSKKNSLAPTVMAITCDKATEQPFSGEFTNLTTAGTYLCRQCGLALFRSTAKFHSACGWPSFDAEIDSAIAQKIDADGHRTEILCARCNAHLGHLFLGEYLTTKNKRYCVNSLSLDFVTNSNVIDTEEAIVAAGCFWGVEYYFKQLAGVLKTEVGYCGGTLLQPTYQAVCAGNSGHIEAIRVIYDPKIISYEAIIKYFFEIHDPTQENGQGPDRGEQYQSAIFYFDEAQKKCSENLIAQLETKNLAIKTLLYPMHVFWRAEDYHQDYYNKTHKEPYCHRYNKRF